jgi:uncharacterized protein YutE (UPF0331/DUF86 family)/predicted nucleotidyltransferase
MGTVERIRPLLARYFEDRSQVAMAFLFGSRATGRHTLESDIDVAVYFHPEGGRLEWEEEKKYPLEESVWQEVEEITGLETDLVVLNRAPSTLAFSILQDGLPLVIKDRSLYWRFYLLTSSAAEDFRSFAREFREIKQRSLSLSEVDRDRLVRILDFLQAELADLPQFEGIERNRYMQDASFRRNAERWAENLVNAAIDIAKIILSSSGKRIPQTYRQALSDLTLLEGFDRDTAAKLGGFARLRNILAHEDLDLRYERIASFIREAGSLFRDLARFTGAFLER